MGNADSMAIGGAYYAIGPILMRKLDPLAMNTKDIYMTEQSIYKDRLFNCLSSQLVNMSFTLNKEALPSSSWRVMKNLGEHNVWSLRGNNNGSYKVRIDG